MSNKNYEYLNNVQKGRTDWKVKVRIIREWRGKNQAGQNFKGFNWILLDAKNVRIQAFVPPFLSEKMQKMFTLGKMYVITNFQVKEYTELDKWRCVNMDRQLMFTNNTKGRELQENEYFIAKNMFDFFEMAELKNLVHQTVYLADVVGVVIKREELRMIRNSKTGKDQLQLRMKMTDGRTKMNVILWDEMAEEFEQEIHNNNFQEPLILIIASGKVGEWKEELDICNFSPTAYYINYNHHSVTQLRKMTEQENWIEQNYTTTQSKKKLKLCTVEEIKHLTADYIQQEVICQITIKAVDETESWYYPQCTSCYYQVNVEGDNSICPNCNRVVPEPDKKFGIIIRGEDHTGEIEIILMDRAIRTIFGKTVFEIEEEEKGNYPTMSKTLVNEDYTLKLLIIEVNIKNKNETYLATDMFAGFNFDDDPMEEASRQQTTEHSMGEHSGTSFHLENISQM